MNLFDRIVSKKRNIFIFLLIVTIISSITLFLIPNINKGHDLVFHLSRIRAIKDNLELGVVGGYIYPNYLGGYGYGNGLFYPDLFLYIPAFLSYLGLNLITSYKIFLFLINLSSVFSMYYSVKKITNNKKCALLSSVVYGFSSYRLADVFIRAALGEALSFIFMPLVILGVYEIIYRDYKKFYILVIGMTGLLLSHLISTYLMGILLIILCLINIKKFWNEKKRFWYLILSAFVTLLLTSYFVFPMLEQMIDGEFYFNKLSEHSSLPLRSAPFWSIFIGTPHEFTVELFYEDFVKLWIPGSIGISFIVLIICYIKNLKRNSQFVNFCFITAIILMFCSTDLFPWDLFQNVMYPIQFPWRLFILITLLISIGGGVLFENVDLKFNIITIIMSVVSLVPVVVVSTQCFQDVNIDEILEYSIAMGEYMPSMTYEQMILDRGNIIAAERDVAVKFEQKGLVWDIDFFNNEAENKFELPILYYKGYNATINGQNLKTYKTEYGLLGVDIPNIETGLINVFYKGTTVQLISKVTSLVSFIIFSLFIIKKQSIYTRLLTGYKKIAMMIKKLYIVLYIKNNK